MRDAVFLGAFVGFAGGILCRSFFVFSWPLLALAPLIGLPAHALLSSILFLAQFSASLPFASVQIPQFPVLVVPVAYAALAYVVWKAKAPPRALSGAR